MKNFYIIATVVCIAYCCRGFFFSPTQEKNDKDVAPTTSIQATVSTAEPTMPVDVTSVPAPISPMAMTPAPIVMPVQLQEPNKVIKNLISPFSPEEDLEDAVIICIAYTEIFKAKAYRCCGQWLIGYGQSRINGHYVHSGMTIDELTAQQEVRKHLRYYVFPSVKKLLKRKVTEGEFITCCLLAYNMGTGGFAKCSFLKALNEGKSQEECLKCLKGHGGVAKRRWVDAALFTGAIDAYDLLDLSAGGCYNFQKKDLYQNGHVDLSPKKVEEFLTSDLNQRGKRLIDII